MKEPSLAAAAAGEAGSDLAAGTRPAAPGGGAQLVGVDWAPAAGPGGGGARLVLVRRDGLVRLLELDTLQLQRDREKWAEEIASDSEDREDMVLQLRPRFRSAL